MKKKINIRKIIGSAAFKFSLVSVFALSILFSFSKSLSKFNCTDAEPRLQNIDVERTREFAAFTVHVATGMFIRNFPYFNMIENKFTIDMVVWFSFDPTQITLDTIGKFAFENGKILDKSPADIKIIGGKTFAKYDVIVEVKSDLNYNKFPLEDHKLGIILTNNFVTPYEVLFEVLVTDFVVATNIFVPDWQIRKLDTNFGIDENILNQVDKTKKIAYPKATFTIDFEKTGIRKVFIIFAPIFIIFFLSFFAFFLVISDTFGRATLSVSALTALLGYRFVIEGMMPKVGYFTTTDQIYIILLAFAFINTIFQITLTRLFFLASKNAPSLEKHLTIYSLVSDIVFIFIVVSSTILLCSVII